jgi:7-cyano-7-deazaguanine synthase
LSLVTLVSGGLDSTLVALMAKEEGVEQRPLFIDYGQVCAKREWEACRSALARLSLPRPKKMDLSGFGRAIPCGLTDRKLRINEDAFLPGRNLLFLLCGAAYAYALNADGVAIGLLSEEYKIFPDQSEVFLRGSSGLLYLALGRKIRLVAPLMALSKREVLILAKERGISGTYSCHGGGSKPCGECVSCREALAARQKTR